MLYPTVIAIIFLFCWGTFFLTWVGGALYNFFKGPQILRRGTNSWRWWLIGIIGILLVRFAINTANNAHAALWSTLAFNVPELQFIGAILLIASTLFALWSRFVLGTMWSPAAAVKSDHQLRTDGPYRITRHPIYTGMLGMLAGTALVFLVALPVLLISLAVFLSKISNEEQLMAEQFGEQYTDVQDPCSAVSPRITYRKEA